MIRVDWEVYMDSIGFSPVCTRSSDLRTSALNPKTLQTWRLGGAEPLGFELN